MYCIISSWNLVLIKFKCESRFSSTLYYLIFYEFSLKWNKIYILYFVFIIFNWIIININKEYMILTTKWMIILNIKLYLTKLSINIKYNYIDIYCCKKIKMHIIIVVSLPFSRGIFCITIIIL